MKRGKWVNTVRDVVSVYILCWAASWLACLFFLLLNKGELLEDLGVVNYIATLSLLAYGGMLAMFLGLLFAGFSVGSMWLTMKLWRNNKPKTNIFTVAIALIWALLQFLAEKSVLGDHSMVYASPFAVADLVAGVVTAHFLPTLSRS